MSEDSKCLVELVPMQEWVNGEDEIKCRPCLVGPVVRWYRDELKEQGESDKAASLENIAENPDTDPLQICIELDKIKSEVGASLRERLTDFDCLAQSFEQDKSL